jgi:hypothetical protein
VHRGLGAGRDAERETPACGAPASTAPPCGVPGAYRADVRGAGVYRAAVRGPGVYRAGVRGPGVYRAGVRGAGVYRAAVSLPLMSAQSAQTLSGTAPSRMSSANTLHPRQYAKIDSSPAAITNRTSTPSAAA